MLFKEVISVYTGNQTRPINIKTALVTVREDVTYSYHSALKGRWRLWNKN
jgi:hypothetical protein